MYTKTLTYTSREELQAFATDNHFSEEPNVLVQVFSGILDRVFLEDLRMQIKGLLPSAKIIGATTDGEINRGNVATGSVLISISVFENTKITTEHIADAATDSFLAGVAITKAICKSDTKVLILFGE